MSQEVKYWRKPKGGYLKCNLDAYVLHNMGKTSYRVVVRDSQGSFVVGLISYFGCILNFTLAEGLSLQEVLTFWSDHEWALIDIEMDSKICVSAMQLREDNISEFS